MRSRVARAACAVTAVSAVALAACSSETAEGRRSATDTAGTTVATAPVPSPVDAAPDFHQPLPSTVSRPQVQKLVDEGLLPLAPAHGGAFETMTNALVAGPTPDVMLFGDSMVQQGVDPEELGRVLSEATGQEVRVFNGASSRARWGINRMLARYAVQSDRAPKVALLGITTRAAESDQFYRDDAAITAFSAMVEGCDRPLTAAWDAADQQRCQRQRDDVRARFLDGGGQVRRALAGLPPQVTLDLGEGSRLREDGFMIHPSVTVARAKEIGEQRIRRGFPGYPRAEDEPRATYRSMVQELEDAGVTVITFELPYPPVYQDLLETSWPGYDARRQQAAKDLIAGSDVKHFPIARMGDWWGDGSSRDAIHLAPEGAKGMARQLARQHGFVDAVLAGLD